MEITCRVTESWSIVLNNFSKDNNDTHMSVILEFNGFRIRVADASINKRGSCAFTEGNIEGTLTQFKNLCKQYHTTAKQVVLELTYLADDGVQETSFGRLGHRKDDPVLVRSEQAYH